MSKPIVAIVGRPNVGKSTLFNVIAGDTISIVKDTPGVTRDRIYADCDWLNMNFTLIDTGGIEPDSKDIILSQMREQAEIAISTADVIIFIVDVRQGLVDSDAKVADMLRKSRKPVVLAVNKVDSMAKFGNDVYEFYNLGIGEPVPVSAASRLGIGDLLDEVVKHFDGEKIEEEEDDRPRIAVVGKPNVGKSSIINKLLGENRVIVSDIAGTTRDAVDTEIVYNGMPYVFIDTAGLRRKSQIDEDVEYYGFVRAMRAIDRADVALLVIDGTLGLTNEDQRVAGYAAERGCAMVIVLNKWDIVEGPEEKAKIRERIEDRMTFVGYAPVVAISALTGKRVDRIWNAIDDVYANYSRTIPTARLNTWLAGIRETGHTVSKGKAVLRMKYLTQTGTCPPHFTFFVNRPDVVDDNYERYLENRMREAFPLEGTPIRLKFKKKD